MISNNGKPKSESVNAFGKLAVNIQKLIEHPVKKIADYFTLSCFAHEELNDLELTSHATCMKELGENISKVQKGSLSLTDKLLDTSCDQSRLADDSAELIEKQTETIKECISLASENAQKITCLQKELFQARRELLSTKLLKSPENMQAMQIYMASIAEKISNYEKVEGKLLDEMQHSDKLEARCIKLTDSVVKLATQNKSQKEKIADLEQELSSHSPRGAI